MLTRSGTGIRYRGRGCRSGQPGLGVSCRMESTVPRYRRVVVKLSGEALAGSGSSGVDPASLSRVAEEVLSVHEIGVQVAVVVGGGNYFRGRMADGWGISRAEADNIGMLGTVMNALMLRGALTARTDADALLVAKHGVDGVYDADPRENPAAVRYTRLTYDEALAVGVRIMDTSAFVLANEQSLTMHVFDVAAGGVMRRICLGAELGTRISAKDNGATVGE